jgi:hypothetical protein
MRKLVLLLCVVCVDLTYSDELGTPALRQRGVLREHFVGGDDNAGSQIGELGWTRATTDSCTTPDTTGQGV